MTDSATTTLGTISGPDPLVVDVGTLDAGERVTVTFQVTVDQDAAGQTITNQAAGDSDQQAPPVYTPPTTTPGGGTVVSDHFIYLPIVMRNI